MYGGLVNVYFGVQIHETGNVLASLTGKKHRAQDWRNANGTVTKVGDMDGDTGAAFEQCVYEYMLSHR